MVCYSEIQPTIVSYFIMVTKKTTSSSTVTQFSLLKHNNNGSRHSLCCSTELHYQLFGGRAHHVPHLLNLNI